jgi:hypothetical protein
VFYRLVCRDITVTECYVGHTTNEVDRRYNHKSDCTNEKGERYNRHVYRFIRDHGGFENWQLLVIEQLAVKDKVAAVLRERHWCELYNATLNSNVPGRTRAEYNLAHREEAAAHYVEHRAEVLKRQAAHYAANKDRIKEKHDCPCGGKHTTGDKLKHFRTVLHCAYIAALPTV